VKKYEYKIVNTTNRRDIEFLNEQGQEGWKLITVDSDSSQGPHLYFYFMREILPIPPDPFIEHWVKGGE